MQHREDFFQSRLIVGYCGIIILAVYAGLGQVVTVLPIVRIQTDGLALVKNILRIRFESWQATPILWGSNALEGSN